MKAGDDGSGSRFGTRRFRAMGGMDSACTASHHDADEVPVLAAASGVGADVPDHLRVHRAVAVQVELESTFWKPGFHFIGASVETRLKG